VDTNRLKQILILGGGFGGLYAALELEKTLARDPNVEITLINRENFFLFTPMLHEVAASDLDMTHIVNPVRKLLQRVKFFEGDVEAIDLPNKRMTVSHGTDHHHHDLEYDHLIIAMGSITNFFNLPGLEERALTMKSLGDAIYLRNHMIALLEEADPECCSLIRDQLLTFVVAGGGFAGVETIAGMNDFLREAIEFYPNLNKKLIRVVLVHPGSVILPELGEKLGVYAQKKLSERGVEIKVNAKVTGVSDRGVELSDGTLIKTNTLVWTAGTSPNPMLETLSCKIERGRLVVNEYLEVPDWPGVWALGDCALVPDPKTGQYYPPTAQHALRQGKVLAQNITASIRGGKKKPFSFSTIGQLAAIGRRTGVANIMGINFSGFIAWWLWRTIYLSKLPRFEKKLRVMFDWSLDLLFSKDLVQFTTFRAQTVSHAEEELNHMSNPASVMSGGSISKKVSNMSARTS
jgi:NADH dehydrogenase